MKLTAPSARPSPSRSPVGHLRKGDERKDLMAALIRRQTAASTDWFAHGGIFAQNLDHRAERNGAIISIDGKN